MGNQIVFFDLETTGIDVAHDEIIQIAAVAVDADLVEKESFEVKLQVSDVGKTKLKQLVKDGFPTVYDEDLWQAEGVPNRIGVARFAAWLKKFPSVRQTSKRGSTFMVAQLFGHNAARFDGEFLFRVAREQNTFMPASYHVADTLQLALWAKLLRNFNPGAFNLGELTKHLQIPLVGAHDALNDVRATVEVARKLCELMA